jgi:hypothetical protein
MPYINQEDRVAFESILEQVEDLHTFSPGELNYLITRTCDQYLTAKGFSYTHVNDVVGVLECAKLELYRRLATPYEEQKREENGDVYKRHYRVETFRACPSAALTCPPKSCQLEVGHNGPHDFQYGAPAPQKVIWE